MSRGHAVDRVPLEHGAVGDRPRGRHRRGGGERGGDGAETGGHVAHLFGRGSYEPVAEPGARRRRAAIPSRVGRVGANREEWSDPGLTSAVAVATLAVMLPQARMAAVARIAAALVAVALSGAPRVVALHAPPERHRCLCRAHAGGDHACDCALCRKAAIASRASDGTAPPCHRAAAQKELAAETRRPGGAPCLEGTCGSGARPTLTVAGVEAFCLPATGPLVVAAPERPVPRCAAPLAERALEPETPPPRPRPA